MRRTLGTACACGLLLWVAGCTSLDDFSSLFLLESDNTTRDRVIVGSLDVVAQSTQNTLTQLGFTATTTREGDTVRIASKTRHGDKFTLVLVREKSADGKEQTRVRVEWDGRRDDQTGYQILSRLEAVRKS